MKKSDMKKFIVCMATLYEIYEKEGSKTKDEIYFNILEEYTIDQISASITAIIKQRVYSSFPKPADIISLIGNEQVNIEDIALSQWITVKETINRVGTYTSVRFDDPLIHKVINSMGGWIDLGQTETDQIQWKEKEFIRNYCLMSKQQIEEIDCSTGYLPGIHSTSYLNQKYEHEVKIVEIKTLYPKEMKNIEQKPKAIIKELATKLKRVK